MLLSLSAGNSFVYGAFFGIYTSIITHTALNHRREIVSGFNNLIGRKSAFANSKDIHTRLMRSYDEVPEWAYLIVLCVSIGIGAAGVAVYPTNTSPAVVLSGVSLAVIFCIPCGIIMATTNVEVTLNIIAEFIGSLWFPGNATAMNYFKLYGFITTSHTLHFAQNLKLAHYIYIPPWVTFSCQMFATLVSTFICTATLNYQMTKIPDVCTPKQKDHFTCPVINSFFTSSVLSGPRRCSVLAQSTTVSCGASSLAPSSHFRSTSLAGSGGFSSTSTSQSSCTVASSGLLITFRTFGPPSPLLGCSTTTLRTDSSVGGQSTTSTRSLAFLFNRLS